MLSDVPDSVKRAPKRACLHIFDDLELRIQFLASQAFNIDLANMTHNSRICTMALADRGVLALRGDDWTLDTPGLSTVLNNAEGVLSLFTSDSVSSGRNKPILGFWKSQFEVRESVQLAFSSFFVMVINRQLGQKPLYASGVVQVQNAISKTQRHQRRLHNRGSGIAPDEMEPLASCRVWVEESTDNQVLFLLLLMLLYPFLPYLHGRSLTCVMRRALVRSYENQWCRQTLKFRNGARLETRVYIEHLIWEARLERKSSVARHQPNDEPKESSLEPVQLHFSQRQPLVRNSRNDSSKANRECAQYLFYQAYLLTVCCCCVHI